MAQITKGSQYIACALYFFCYCSWGVVQRFPRSGVTKQPLEMPGDRLGGCAESLRRFVPADF
jgi:hypothetical protein